LQISDCESDDSEDEIDEFWDIILSGARVAEKYVELYLDKNPKRIADQSGMGWLQYVLRTPGECHSQLRMSTEIFMDLHDILVSRYGLQPSLHMNTYEALAIFLFTCSGNESNRKSQNRFNHSGETISRKFGEVLNCFMEMAKHFVVPKDPNFRTVHQRIRDDRRAYPYFKNCIGALDGTHIRVALHPNEQVRYIGKSGIPTQNVLAICDFDMRFTYVSVGQPGSVHDTTVLYNAMKVDQQFFPHPPQSKNFSFLHNLHYLLFSVNMMYYLFVDKYYVVDAGYPNRVGYLAPYKGERYHLPEWHRGMEPKSAKEKFNRIHARVRSVVERSFGVLKMKWQILYKMAIYPLWKQKMIVVACMVIHNFIREHNADDLDFERVERDENYVPTIPERYNKYVVPSDGSTSLPNAPTMDDFRDELATAIATGWN
jgi:hypothetical protein